MKPNLRLFKIFLILIAFLVGNFTFAQQKALTEKDKLAKEAQVVKGNDLKADVIPGGVTKFNYNKPVHSKVDFSTKGTRGLLYDNGPFVTNPGGGVGGADVSLVETPNTSYGFNFNSAAAYHVADNFVVTDNVAIDSLVFHGYQTNSTLVSTFTGLYIQIWNGDPSLAGSAIIWGDLTTNKLTATYWSGCYRAADLTTTARPLMNITAATSGLILPAGEYWIDFAAVGSLTSGPWVPPITVLGQIETGNAIQWTGAAWAPITDAGSLAAKGLPFLLYGNVVLDPSILFSTDFESYIAGTQVACQSADWTTWSNLPCGTEDAMVSTDFAHSGVNAVKDNGLNDLILLLGNKVTGKYEFSFWMYIPTGYGGYYNLLHNFAGAASEWGLEFYFEDAGTAQLHAGGVIIPYPYNHDQWFKVTNLVDLDNDLAEVLIDGTSVYSWQWSLDPSTGNPGLNQLGAVDFYSGSGATGIVNPLYYFDDVLYKDISGPPPTLDPPRNLAATVSGQNVHLTWDPPSGGGSTEELIYDDGVPSDGYTYDGYTMSSRMSPSGPCKILELKYYTTAANPANNSFEPRVFNWLGSEPGTTILYETTANAVDNDWTVVDISAENILVDGDFMVGFGSVNTETFMGFNTTDNGRAWDYYNTDGTWASWNETYFLRAVVEYTDGRVVELSPVNTPPGTKIPQARLVNHPRGAGIAHTVAPMPSLGSRALLGYNAYRDGTKLNAATITDLFYDDMSVTPGTYNYTATAVYDEGESAPVGPVQVTINPGGITIVNIGEGTELPSTPRSPFDYYWKNSLCESLYFPAEMGQPAGSQIIQVDYYNNFVTNLTDKPVKIWMGETSLNDLSGGYISATDLTLVYDGTVSFPSGTNTISIPLQVPYTYGGGNLVILTNHLLEAVYYSSSDQWYSTTTPDYANRSVGDALDATEFDPYNPPSPPGYTNSIIPNTSLYFTSGGGSVIYSNDFEGLTVGGQLACQDPVNWTTWDAAPCSPTDAYISSELAHSPVKSVVVEGFNDEVLLMGNKTTGKYELNFYMYMPLDFCGYYNILQDFQGATSTWGLEVYFHTDGTGIINAGGNGAATFNYPKDSWLLVKNVVDLDNDLAELFIDGVSIYSWQWSLGATGTAGILQLSAADFYAGADANYPTDVPKYFFDDLEYKQASAPANPRIVVTPASLSQMLLPNTTGTQTLNIANTGGGNLDFSIDISYPVVKSVKIINHKPLAERVTVNIPIKGGQYTVQKNTYKVIPEVVDASAITKSTSLVNKHAPKYGRATVYVNQTGNPSVTYGGIASQTFEAANAAYSCAGADDFEVPGGATWNVGHVFVNGTYSTGSEVPAVDVVFYSDASGFPGSAIATFTGISCISDASGNVNVFLPSVVTLSAGRYWVSVAANMAYGTYGQWYWTRETDPLVLNEFTWQNPGDGFLGCTSWCYGSVMWPAQADYNLAFALTDSVQAPPPSGWLSAAPLTGSVPAGGSVNVQVTFDANGLAVGTYNGLIAISSNDPTHPVKEVPAQLQVKIPGALPLIEDWSSGSYGTNDWTFEPSQSNWTISTYNGNPAPAAEFYWSPSLTGYDYSLVSPSLDASAISDNVTLKFDIYLSNFSSATLEQLAVEVYNGSSWELVQNFDNVNGSIAWTSESFNITSMAAGHAFNVRFRAYGENSFNINNWDLDNIKVYRQVVGNLTGTITKLSDASPIEGAAIAITNAVSGTYATTSGANGVYTLNGVEAGDYAFDVLKEGYNSIEGNLTIVGNETVTHDFQMTAPIVTVDPASLTVTVDVGTTTTREVTVTNSGNGPVNWSGSIHSNKQLSSVPASNGNFPRGSSAVSIGRAPAGTSMPSKPLNGRGDIGYAFDIYPGMTFFSFNTDDPATQNVISTIDYAPFGGSFDAVNTDFMYIIDYNTNTLKKVAIADGTVTDIGSCIPFGAESWTGIAVDKSSNIMYGISTDITESHIYTIDMITGAATVIGPTGIPGAIDCAIDGTGQMYSFDLVNDESYKVDKATGASSLLGSIGYDANYAQGMGWDPTSDIVYIAAYNGATGAGELRILDRVTGNTTLVGGMGGEIDGLAFPGGGGGNWASIDPATGTIAPGGSQIVTVTFDGSYVPPQKDLTVTGNLVFATDPNVGSPEVALSMTITGAFFGVLTGTVTHGGIPVEGVTVTATRQEPPIYTYSMVTGADGVYAFPSTLYGTYDFTAEKAGFNPFISTVPAVVIGDVTTVYNIAMVAPILVINPLEITEEALFGNIITRTVMVTNAGDGWLDWKAVAAAIDKKATVSVPASDGKFARGTAAPSIMRAPAGTSMPSKPLNGKGTLGYAFDIYPGNTFFSFDTDDPSTQNVISSIDYAPFGGTFDATHTDFMYIIDYNTNTLKKVEVATGAVTDIGACNPTGAESWTGITVDKSTNIMYGISTDITESHIYHIDMETGAATVIGPTGIPGAIDCTIDGTGQMYSFDIVNDEAYKVDKETGASQLLGSIGYDANYAQGMGWDPEADIVYLAAYNGATGAGELRILDRVTGNTTLVGTFGGEIDALAFPGGGTPPWLSITPKTGILPAGASEEMTVTLDGTIPPPAKDFTHHGSITFTSLPDVGTVIVPVTFTVTGDFYGKLEGYVKHDGVGIPNATVEAVKAGTPTYSATTDANGHYLIDPILGGTYEVTATATGFIPTSVTGVVITPPNTTMLDLILTAPTMNITPGELVVNLPAGQTTDCTLNISNTGDGMLAWVGSVHINAKQAVSIPASNGVFPRGTAAPSIGRAPVNGTAGTPEFKVVRGSLGYAFDIYPGNTFFSFNTDDPATQNVISSIDYAPFGGTFDAMNLDFMYVIDYNTNTLKKVAIADGTVTDIGSCSPYGAESWTGITVDKTTNIMYGISTDITESHIYTIDMVTGAATVIGPTGIPGAIDVTVDGTGQMYSFDIVNDEAYAINKETGASTLLGSIGYDANYAQGMGWDPAADIVYLAAYNGATGAGELRILDRVTGNTTLVGGMGGEIDGLGFPGGGSAWLSMDPRQGVVPAGNSMNTNVHFDATDLAEGTYTGFITFLSEPNVGTVNVPVTLVVGQIGGPTLTISQVFDVPAGPVSVPVHATEITNMGSFQFTLDFDASKLTYTGTSNWYTGITDVLVGTPAAGKLTFVWAASTAGITITDGIFFNVDFTYNGSLDFANIGWSDNPTPREFADYNGTIFLPYYNSGFVTGRGVGVPENGPQSIKVYPNPASDVVNVKSDFTIKSIEVLSFIGQTVYTQNNLDTKQIQLNVSSFGSGVYFVKLNTSEGVKTTKITVKH